MRARDVAYMLHKTAALTLQRGSSVSREPHRVSASSLLYISNGNIPSRWAHTVQTMKMCEALAQLVPDFRLLVATSLRDLVAPRIDLLRWYGIEKPFSIVRLPLWIWRPPLFEGVRERRFSFVAPRWAARARPALVWTRSAPVAIGCLQRGLPVVFERHSPPGKWGARLAEMGASPLLRGFVVLSEKMFEDYRSAGIPAEKIGAFPSAVAPRPTPVARADLPAARRALGLPEHGELALYAGSLSAEKGLPTLLAAAGLLPDVRFEVLGGSAADVARWRAQAPANVVLRGFVPHSQLDAWFAAADVGLFPNSARDPLAHSTSPLKALEYIAAGLPVVAAAIPAVVSWMRDGENAFLHAPDDAAGLAQAIRRALADPAGARACAERARSEHGFTWRARAEGVLARFAPELLLSHTA